MPRRSGQCVAVCTAVGICWVSLATVRLLNGVLEHSEVAPLRTFLRVYRTRVRDDDTRI